MNSLVKFIFLSVFGTSLFSSSQMYYSVQEYLSSNNQEIISKNFIKIIQNESVPIAKQDKKVKIVMIYPGNQVSDYWRKSKLSFEKRMKELNIDYELIDFFTKPVTQVKEQSKHLFKALKLNPDYLIFTLDLNKHKNFIERIISKGKTKLILQNITTPIKKWGEKQPFLYVGFDHFTGSKLIADYYIKQTNGKGKYAVLYGSKGYVSFMRGNEIVNYFSKKSQLQLSHEYYTDFDKNKAKKATIDLVKREKDIKFIYACSTDIALGAIEALEEMNLLGKIKVNGWGGGNSELEAIEKNLLDMTVMRMNDDNGVAMAEAIKKVILNKAHEVPTIYSGEFELVKKGINKENLESLKRKAFRYTLDD